MSLYGLDESVRQLLRLDRFSTVDFSAKDFIEQLRSSQPDASADDEVLDPKPYIRTFEAVMSELERLRDVAQHGEDSAGQAAEALRDEFNTSALSLAGHVDATVAQIKLLDEQVSDVTRATNFVGDRLERIAAMHQQARTSRRLVEYYVAFLSRGECPELQKLWTSENPTDRRHCAQIVGHLQLLAHKIGDIPGSEKAEHDIDKFAEQLEMHFVNLFQDAYASFDLLGMREIAHVLHDFNGGASIVQAFVNQHDFFMQIDKIDDNSALQDEQMWEHLTDLNSAYPEFETVISSLVDDVVDTVMAETDIIRKVFPEPAQVLTVFMQRTFGQRIQGQVSMYIEEAESRSPLAHVRVLYVCYHLIGMMVKTLKFHWSKQNIDADGELALMLDSNFSDTFVMYIDKYFATELRSLEKIISLALHKSSSRSQEPRREDSPRLQRAQSHDDSGSGYDTDEDSAATEPENDDTRMGKFFRAVRLERGNTVRKKSSVSIEDCPLVLADLEIVLAAFAEAVGREQVLSLPTRIAYDAGGLFDLLIVEVGRDYVFKALDLAIDHTSRVKADRANWEFLDVIRRSANCVQMIALFVRTVLFSMVSGSESRQAEMATNINQYISTAQELCTTLLEGVTDCVHQQTVAMFERQKTEDFSRASNIEAKPSAVCGEIIRMLQALNVQMNESLSGDNLQNLRVALSGGLYNNLVTHIKKRQHITPYGGRVLAADLHAYEQLVVEEWGVSEVADSFATLKAVAKLFYADVQMLPSLLRDSRFARLRPDALQGYVRQRQDFYSRNLQLLFLGKTGYRYTLY